VKNLRNDIDELIGKYLAGEASHEEREVVDGWRGENESNRQYFSQIQTIFARAATVSPDLQFDEDAAWNKVRARLKQTHGKVVNLQPERPANNAWSILWKIAASILLVAVVGFFAYQNLQSSDDAVVPVQVIAEKKTVRDTLPDGSEVVLNKKTRLTYAYDSRKKEHRVKLKGEAYFSMAHEEKKNFVVDVEGVFIRDIGTSFNVKAYPNSNTIEVVVEEGEVIFYTETDSGLTLKANGKGIYDRVTKQFSVDQPEANVTAYKTRYFVFSGTSLAEVARQLNAVYDRKVIVSEAIQGCQLTVDFDNDNLESIVDVISQTLQLKVRDTPQGILLEGTTCGE
jgi:ferric-dicitrate binding protein FerR (iron transport regulator)